MKNVSIETRSHIINVRYGTEFAIMNRYPDSKGLRKITFSIPLKSDYADAINASGIADVEEINYDECSITFQSQPFYETHLISSLIANILIRHDSQND